MKAQPFFPDNAQRPPKDAHKDLAQAQRWLAKHKAKKLAPAVAQGAISLNPLFGDRTARRKGAAQ